jgi:hypothetical protein
MDDTVPSRVGEFTSLPSIDWVVNPEQLLVCGLRGGENRSLRVGNKCAGNPLGKYRQAPHTRPAKFVIRPRVGFTITAQFKRTTTRESRSSVAYRQRIRLSLNDADGGTQPPGAPYATSRSGNATPR